MGLWKDWRERWVALACIAALFAIIIGGTAYGSWYGRININNKLRSNGFQIVSAQFDSPTITIQVNNITALMQIANECHTSTIYNQGSTYLVLANSTIGYEYGVSAWWIWSVNPQ